MTQLGTHHTTPLPIGRSLPAGFGPAAGVWPPRPGVKTPEDPVLTLVQRYRAIEAARAEADRRRDEIRALHAERCGDVGDNEPVDVELAVLSVRLGAEIRRSCERSDELNMALCGVTDLIMNTPAVSLAGLRAKMKIGVELWPVGDWHAEESEFHEDVALAFLKDGLRLLDEVLP